MMEFQLPSPFQIPYLGVALLQTCVGLVNFVFALNIFRLNRTKYTYALLTEHLAYLGFCGVNLTRNNVSDVGRNMAAIHLAGDVFYNVLCLLHIHLMISRFSMTNIEWYPKLWDSLMQWGALAVFLLTAVVGMGFQVHRVTLNLSGDEKLWPWNTEIPICYALYTVFLLVVDIVLGYLMYRRVNFLKAEANSGSQSVARLHRRTVYGLAGIVGMSWIAIIIYVGATATQAALSKVLTIVTYLAVGVHLSFALLYMQSIKELLQGYGHHVHIPASKVPTKACSVDSKGTRVQSNSDSAAAHA